MIAALAAFGRPFFLVLAFAIIWTPAAHAKTIILDDSGTQALEPSVSMHWKRVTPSRTSPDNTMIGTTVLRVRINVMPWLKHAGRIYLVLPAQPPGPMAAAWTTEGRFMAGQLRSGNRVLVYAGPITTPFMEDVFRMQFSLDGSLMRRTLPVNFHFEMDED
jgi:hypothetical protein